MAPDNPALFPFCSKTTQIRPIEAIMSKIFRKISNGSTSCSGILISFIVPYPLRIDKPLFRRTQLAAWSFSGCHPAAPQPRQ
jgi:hypothetical protein